MRRLDDNDDNDEAIPSGVLIPGERLLVVMDVDVGADAISDDDDNSDGDDGDDNDDDDGDIEGVNRRLPRECEKSDT